MHAEKGGSAEADEAEELTWSRETVPKALKIVSARLHQRDVVSLLLVSPWLNQTLVSHPPLWLVLTRPVIFTSSKSYSLLPLRSVSY